MAEHLVPLGMLVVVAGLLCVAARRAPGRWLDWVAAAIALAIARVLGFGISIGWRNGLVGPLLCERSLLSGCCVVSRNPALARLVPSSVPRAYALLIRPAVVGLIVGLVCRMDFHVLARLPF